MNAQPEKNEVQELKDSVTSLQATVQNIDQHYKALLLATPDAKARYDAARAAYSEYGSQIRHFSTTRSALTVFLVTAGMTALAAYLDKRFLFLFVASVVFAGASLCVCLWFSYLTEKHVLRYKDIWNLLNGKPSEAKLENLTYDPGIFAPITRMLLHDAMNWLLLVPVVAFLWHYVPSLIQQLPRRYFPW